MPTDQETLFELLDGLCNGTITPDEHRRLGEFLAEDPVVRRLYFDYLDLHLLLRQWRQAAVAEEDRQPETSQSAELSFSPPPAFLPSPFGIGDGAMNLPAPFGIRDGAMNLPSLFGRGAGGGGDVSEIMSPESPFGVPHSVLRTPYSSLSTLYSTLSSSLLTPGGVLFSYGVSAVLVALGLMLFSMMSVGDGRSANVVRNEPKSPMNATQQPECRPTPERELVSVARITGMVDCRWVNADKAPFHNKIKMHDKFALASGLMEITYHTGARVILQGPCTYEVESTAGGYLSLGKLTARVEKKSGRGGEGGRGRLVNSTSPANSAPSSSPPLPLSHSPTLFSIRTPTATVTDLGTEFGVEVGEKGETLSHVFVGKVRVKQIAAEGGQPDREVVLGADESVRVESLGGQSGSSPLTVVRGDLNVRKFVRPEQMALKIKEVRERPLQEHRRWREFSDQLRGRDDLVAYYDFQRDDDRPRDVNGSEIMRNRAKTGAALDGVLVGAVRLGMARGRWPGKQALEFNNFYDGVRVNIPGRMSSCTLAAWVNVNWQPDNYCGILLSDKYYAIPGALHWQMISDGRMQAAVNIIGANHAYNGINWCTNQPALNVNQSNVWHHVAVVFDNDSKSVVAYMDGRPVRMSPHVIPGAWTPIEIGRASIGSWNCRERPLGGRIDELMIFNRALSAGEIQSLIDGRRSDTESSEIRGVPLGGKKAPSKQLT